MSDELKSAERISIKCRDLLTDKTIEIEKPVLASLGAFVVVEHPSGTFSVTHKPCGWRATASTTERGAVSAMKKLHHLPLDWAAMNPENCKAMARPYADRIAEIKRVAERDLFHPV